MYMYCKAVHGELVGEIAEEFAREYVSLPFDDGKVPHLVSVAYNNIWSNDDDDDEFKVLLLCFKVVFEKLVFLYDNASL